MSIFPLPPLKIEGGFYSDDPPFPISLEDCSKMSEYARLDKDHPQKSVLHRELMESFLATTRAA